jgi:hypothetical protein
MKSAQDVRGDKGNSCQICTSPLRENARKSDWKMCVHDRVLHMKIVFSENIFRLSLSGQKKNTKSDDRSRLLFRSWIDVRIYFNAFLREIEKNLFSMMM